MISLKEHSPIIGPVKCSITMKISWNSMSPPSNLSSIVLLGVSSCPFATMIWKFGGGTFRITDCGARSRIFRRSISGIALDSSPVSISPSMVNYPKSIGKYNMRFLHLRLMVVDRVIQSGSPSLVMRIFWNCFSSNNDCEIGSAQVSVFSVPKGFGITGWFVPSFIFQFSISALVFLLWVIGGFSNAVLL